MTNDIDETISWTEDGPRKRIRRTVEADGQARSAMIGAHELVIVLDDGHDVPVYTWHLKYLDGDDDVLIESAYGFCDQHELGAAKAEAEAVARALLSVHRPAKDAEGSTSPDCEALAVAARSGGIDGAHHKAWVIDQMVRQLTGDGYADWVAAFESGDDGPDTYQWEVGVAP